MRKCWNRQTGTFEVRVSMTCGFKSHLPHQIKERQAVWFGAFFASYRTIDRSLVFMLLKPHLIFYLIGPNFYMVNENFLSGKARAAASCSLAGKLVPLEGCAAPRAGA